MDSLKKAVLCLFVFAATAASVFPSSAAAAQKEAPLRIAVFTGSGARNIGSFRWVEIASMAENAEPLFVDGASIRAGALDSADILIMPGGSATLESRDLGEEGRKKLKDWIRQGGGYIGTCAGCYLLMEPHEKSKQYLSLIPYKDGTSGGRADLLVKFNAEAKRLAGIPECKHRMRYGHGPVPVPTGHAIEGSDFKVVATYACNINQTPKARKSFAGKPAAFAGTFGKGRVFVFTVHPEYDVEDHKFIAAALKFITGGRDVKWSYPQRKPGSLAVGFLCTEAFGPETAKFIRGLLKSREFDIVPVSGNSISEGELRHLDAILAPPYPGGGDGTGALLGENLERTREFAARGGRIIAWGRQPGNAKKKLPEARFAKNAQAAIAELRKFAGEPAAQPQPAPAKIPRPVKIAVFADDGCSMGTIPPALEFSPEYEVGIVGGKDVAAGALRGYDALFMPGGYSSIAYVSLGEAGRSNLVEFVRGGGRYYGVCGGAFLVSQTCFKPGNQGMKPGDERFIGLVPFKEDLPHPYRGKAFTSIRLTGEGEKVFGGKDAVRKVWYAGGPAFIDALPVEDSEYEVFARYEGRIVSTGHAEKSPVMKGKVALAGGRVGKGRVYVQCPHPESYEFSFEMVRDAFKWLTGKRPSAVNRDRVRGAKSVYVKMGFRKGMNEAVKFVLKTLLHDRRFDCRIDNTLNANRLPHADAAVICLFDKTSWTPEMKRFAANGGKAIFVADTPAKRKIAEGFAGATVVDSYDKVVPELEK